eukprot:3154514-Rhodomonas_salina.1
MSAGPFSQLCSRAETRKLTAPVVQADKVDEEERMSQDGGTWGQTLLLPAMRLSYKLYQEGHDTPKPSRDFLLGYGSNRIRIRSPRLRQKSEPTLRNWGLMQHRSDDEAEAEAVSAPALRRMGNDEAVETVPETSTALAEQAAEAKPSEAARHPVEVPL